MRCWTTRNVFNFINDWVHWQVTMLSTRKNKNLVVVFRVHYLSESCTGNFFFPTFFQKIIKLFLHLQWAPNLFLMDRKVFGAPLNIFLHISAMSRFFFGESNSKRSSKTGKNGPKGASGAHLTGFWGQLKKKTLQFFLYLQCSSNLFYR